MQTIDIYKVEPLEGGWVKMHLRLGDRTASYATKENPTKAEEKRIARGVHRAHAELGVSAPCKCAICQEPLN